MSQSKVQIERDCTEKCRSLQHGNLISSVITKRQVTDEEICAYIRWLCGACGHICDSMGRIALHFAASCGRTKLVRWLIRNRGANINAKDLESGYTALHRSIFYGKINCAVALIQLGANIALMDHNDLTPLEHAMKDKMSKNENFYGPNQIYVWGTNTNYTLGTGSQHSRQHPELNDAFHNLYKNCQEFNVRQIYLEKFHCVILGEIIGDCVLVYSCGHGQGGRLGLNTEKTILVPQEINFPRYKGEYYFCKEISIARDHSLFLSHQGVIMSCGLNTHHVLGIKPPPKQLLVPTHVPLRAAAGICAGRFHSVAWGPGFIYSWGLHAGQLGHPQSNIVTIVSPKLIPSFLHNEDQIITVAASDGATVIATKKGDIFALHQYQCRKIASRQLNIKKIVVIGGHLNPKVSSDILTEKGGNELKILVLLESGNLLIWKESWSQLSRCIYNLNRPLIVTDAVLSRTELFFVTKDGEAFKGEFRTRKKKLTEQNHEKKSAFHEFLEKDECQFVNVTKFSHIHRAVLIECDHKGRNFAVLQKSPQVYSMDGEKWPRSTLPEEMLNLLNTADEMDNIHDGVFKVAGIIFPVHKYIIGSKSEILYSMLHSSNNSVEIPNIHPYIFKQILTFIYTNTCDFIQLGNLISEVLKFCEQANNEKSTNKNENEYFNENKYHNKQQKNPKMKKEINIKNPLVIMQQAAKRFGVSSLCKIINNLRYSKGSIDYKDHYGYFDSTYHFEFNRKKFTNICDVVLKSETGYQIEAHKCILARLEYFNNLFAVRWNEKSLKSIVSLPVCDKVLDAVVDFLYTDTPMPISNDIEFVTNVLIISDQLFIENLKYNCEIHLSEMLTLRNIAQILQFSDTYHAGNLKFNCEFFIKHNLAAVLETRCLEILDDKVLDDLTNFYCYNNNILSKRVITPFFDAPSDEDVKNIHELYPLNTKDYEENIDKKTPKMNRKKIRTRRTSHKNLDSSLESNTSFNEVFEEEIIEKENKTDEKWVKILTEKEKHQKIVQNRLKAISNAKEEVEGDKLSDNLTKLTSQLNLKSVSTPIPMKSPKETVEVIKSPTMSDIPIQKAQKLSQKQRKKLAQELSLTSMAEELDKINNKSWNTIMWSKENNSFSDIIKNESLHSPELSGSNASPKNPWQKVELASPIASPETKQDFKDIVAGEKRLKENWTKMRERPLIYIQMEDKAISELERFYNIDNVTDEYITIHKVEKRAFAVPLWVQPNNKH